MNLPNTCWLQNRCNTFIFLVPIFIVWGEGGTTLGYVNSISVSGGLPKHTKTAFICFLDFDSGIKQGSLSEAW